MGKADTAGEAPTSGMTTYSPSERELLRAVRDLVAADRRMRQRLGTRMQLNLHDLQAMRHVLTAHREDGFTTPRRLAEELGISSASTTILVDRLVAQGHLVRAAHPTDGRSRAVLPTETARQEMEEQLGRTHVRMREAAAAVPEECRPAVLDYLRALTEVMADEAADPGGSPR
jgi:DNA-binding MarR family transcriptional regulator